MQTVTKSAIRVAAKQKLGDSIDRLFAYLHDEFKTESGDIYPHQHVEFEQAINKAVEIITQQVWQNIPYKHLIDKDEVYRIVKYGSAYAIVDGTLLNIPITIDGELSYDEAYDVDFQCGFECTFDNDKEKKEFMYIIEAVTGWKHQIHYFNS